MNKKVRKAVFPVGGLGTRFLPATKSVPKEMLPVVDKPIIHYAYEEALEAGIEEFIFVTARNKGAIEEHFDHAFELEHTLSTRGKKKELSLARDWLPPAGSISFIRQMEPSGLGHAVWCARNAVGNEPFAVILPDDMVLAKRGCIAQMVNDYKGGNMAAVMEVPREKTKSYGILDIKQDEGKVVVAKGLVEKPDPKDAPSTLSIIGRYILDPGIFTALTSQGRGSGGEIQLTDAMSNMISKVPFYGYRFDGKRYDCGDKVGYIEANVAYALHQDDMKDQISSMLKGFVKG